MAGRLDRPAPRSRPDRWLVERADLADLGRLERRVIDRHPLRLRNGRSRSVSHRHPIALAMGASLGARLRTGHHSRGLALRRHGRAGGGVSDLAIRLAHAVLGFRSRRIDVVRRMVLLLSRYAGATPWRERSGARED